ncbi:nuclear transport factor 2 family protein [Mycobacterium sp. 21AC1]|uniref:nuclear transport factor 2 family protein n=1 Tax=[Mycobacterium] appelbergii TaxID=2939269 RepID=UPI002938D249|nr:nuclear transport factor 2 family protein [Mycobacterium sp. 21AC1]MDV3128204.1 nuclear transport factor 2 family protein [Mycobacterium sp. 21AC1]
MTSSRALSIVGSEPHLAVAQARAACLDVVTRFFRLVDSGQAAQALKLFTPDGLLIAGGKTFRGATLAEVVDGRGPDGVQRRHFPVETSFRLVSADIAEVETLLQVLELGPQRSGVPVAHTLVHDIFVRDESSSWRIYRRVVRILAAE